MELSRDDFDFLEKYIPNAKILLKSENVNDILDAIDDFIFEYGFAPPDYYDYNDLGRQAQRIRDIIYYSD